MKKLYKPIIDFLNRGNQSAQENKKFDRKNTDTRTRSEKKQSLSIEEEVKEIESTILKTKKGNFRLEYYGGGGICQVFKGTPVSAGKNRILDSCILVKRVQQKWHKRPEVLTQFKREISIVSDFIHPQLPHFVDKGTLVGQDYFAYEFVEGSALINLPKHKDIYPPEKVNRIAPLILMQLLDQLHYFHASMYTIVHGDISVENIVFGIDNRIHLIDFGCAYRKKKVTDESYLWLGKPSYVSPEQAKGDPWAERSDIYQAGILFYELLTGERWNKGQNSRERILFSANASSPQKNFLNQWVDPGISELIAKMLESNQEKRIASAKECKSILKPYVEKIKEEDTTLNFLSVSSHE